MPIFANSGADSKRVKPAFFLVGLVLILEDDLRRCARRAGAILDTKSSSTTRSLTMRS